MTGFTSYQEAQDYLFSLQRFGWKLGLERMLELLQELGNPQEKCKYIHIAGTNGKGSVAAMLESIYRAAGKKTGLFTSPHLVDVRERVRVNGEMVTEQDFIDLVARIRPLREKIGSTFFEFITALAFEYFARQQVDIVILETGLGGRFDATNVITPLLSVITSIDLEHTEHLGKDVASIAREKAGIVKPGVPCVVGDLPDEANLVVQEICMQKNSPFAVYSDSVNILTAKTTLHGTDIVLNIENKEKMSINLPLIGGHQAVNSAIAVAAVSLLGSGIDLKTVKQGLENVTWDGRFQILRREPPVILDVAHNTASIKSLIQVLQTLYPEYKVRFMMGLLNDKDVSSICKMAARVAEKVLLVTPESERSLNVEIIKKEFRLYNIHTEILDSIESGLARIMADKQEKRLYCITGSHYVAGSVKSKIKNLDKLDYFF